MKQTFVLSVMLVAVLAAIVIDIRYFLRCRKLEEPIGNLRLAEFILYVLQLIILSVLLIDP